MGDASRMSRNRYEWVYERMVERDEVAQGDRTVFLAELKSRVTHRVEARPSMLRAGYWKCTR